MVRKINAILASASLVAIIGLTAHAADNRPSPDLNGDGFIDRAEFVSKSNEKFSKMDADSNGLVTKEERRAAKEAQKAMRADKRFERTDADNDGALSRDEIEAARAQHSERRDQMKDRRKEKRLARFDTDGDGVISDAEKSAAKEMRRGKRGEKGQRGKRGKTSADANQDGMISLAEHAAATTARFDRMDKNSDGVLSHDEMPKRRKHKGRKGNRTSR